MPAQKTISPLAKLGACLNKSISAHAKDETDYGIIRIPPGINGGVARLQEARFGTYKTGNNKDKPFLYLMGVAIEPREVNGMRVFGCQTSQTLPICETKTQKGDVTSEDENIETMMNHLRLLGGPEFTAEAKTVSDVEELVKELAEAKPYFRFSTSQGAATKEYPNPRTWENWHGSKGLEDYKEPDDGGGTDDDSEEVEETAAASNGKVSSEAGKGPKKVPVPGKKDLKGKAAKVEEAPEDPEFNDLDSLAERADGGDTDAAAELAEQAANAGIDDEVVTNAESWGDIVALIKGESGEETEGEEVVEEEEVIEEEASGPSVGDVVTYKPLDKATKKPGKAVKCEIVEVDGEAGKVTIKSKTKPPVTYKGVPVSKLES